MQMTSVSIQGKSSGNWYPIAYFIIKKDAEMFVDANVETLGCKKEEFKLSQVNIEGV